MASNVENVSIWWCHHDCGWYIVQCILDIVIILFRTCKKRPIACRQGELWDSFVRYPTNVESSLLWCFMSYWDIFDCNILRVCSIWFKKISFAKMTLFFSKTHWRNFKFFGYIIKNDIFIYVLVYTVSDKYSWYIIHFMNIHQMLGVKAWTFCMMTYMQMWSIYRFQ